MRLSFEKSQSELRLGYRRAALEHSQEERRRLSGRFVVFDRGRSIAKALESAALFTLSPFQHFILTMPAHSVPPRMKEAGKAVGRDAFAGLFIDSMSMAESWHGQRMVTAPLPSDFGENESSPV